MEDEGMVHSHSSTLFLTEEGAPIVFYMTPCAMKSKLRPMIEVRGTFMLLNVPIILNLKRNNAIELPPAATFRRCCHRSIYAFRRCISVSNGISINRGIK